MSSCETRRESTECEREECSFMFVLAVCRKSVPCLISARTADRTIHEDAYYHCAP